MPFTQEDLQKAIGSVFINFWSVQKQQEEALTALQAENSKLSEQLAEVKKATSSEEPVK